MNKRNTIQKQLILNAMNQMEDHPTADEVYQKIAVSYPGISKATVYRNLGTLTEDGLILKLNVPGAADKYDRSTHAHYHAVCSRCGKFIDLETGRPLRIDIDDTAMKDFTIEEYTILFKGICMECKNGQTENTSNDVFNIEFKKSKGEKA